MSSGRPWAIRIAPQAIEGRGLKPQLASYLHRTQRIAPQAIEGRGLKLQQLLDSITARAIAPQAIEGRGLKLVALTLQLASKLSPLKQLRGAD